MHYPPRDMDDPLDRPEFLDNHMREIDEWGQELVRQSEVRAEERRESDEKF